jgi:hypothetical protein
MNSDDIILYKSLINATPDRVVPGIGLLNYARLIAFGDINYVEELIYDYKGGLKEIENGTFAYFCLYLRTKVGLSGDDYYQVALFSHIVSRFKYPDKVHMKQD